MLKVRCSITNTSQRKFEMRGEVNGEKGLISLRAGQSIEAVLPKSTVDAAIAGGAVKIDVLEELPEET